MASPWRPNERASASTNIAVAEDMLPKSRSTLQECSRSCSRQAEHLSGGLQHLAAAGMEQEAFEIVEREPVPVEEAFERLAETLAASGSAARG